MVLDGCVRPGYVQINSCVCDIIICMAFRSNTNMIFVKREEYEACFHVFIPGWQQDFFQMPKKLPHTGINDKNMP